MSFQANKFMCIKATPQWFKLVVGESKGAQTAHT